MTTLKRIPLIGLFMLLNEAENDIIRLDIESPEGGHEYLLPLFTSRMLAKKFARDYNIPFKTRDVSEFMAPHLIELVHELKLIVAVDITKNGEQYHFGRILLEDA